MQHSTIANRCTSAAPVGGPTMRRTSLIAATIGTALAVPASSAHAQNDPVVTWNRELLTILRTPGAQPATIHPTRAMALLHASIADAVSAIDHSGRPWLAGVQGPRRASRVAA